MTAGHGGVALGGGRGEVEGVAELRSAEIAKERDDRKWGRLGLREDERGEMEDLGLGM